ncbi:MAG: UPF0058 family protein [Euryarchaeota archaeon]|nr:UPF0058 family protein [Euryarchaeota archaeon]
MHKDELIQLHTLLCQVRSVVERAGATMPPSTSFKDYESYGVAPQHIHKSKLQHKRAVFLLGKELADALGGTDELSNAHKISTRLGELAKKGTKSPLAPPTPG